MVFWRTTLWIFLSLFGATSLTCNAASIIDSFHDLSHIDEVHVAGWTSVYNNYNEVCVYCHTPHGANDNVTVLWNRSLPDPLSYTLYHSTTLDSLTQPPSPVSLLCLSCHDGTIAVDTVLNMPNDAIPGTKHGSMKVPFDTVYDCAACHSGWMGSDTDFMGSFLGTDFTNDHPVSIEYSTSDAGLVTCPADGNFGNGVRLIDNKVECVSCHNVHDPQYKPFLRIPDTGSALCFTCHIK